MIHFSKKIHFQKETESLAIDFNDKKIKQQRNQLIKLRKEDQTLEKLLNQKNSNYSSYKKQIESQYDKLIKSNHDEHQKIIRLSVKRDQLLSNSTHPHIKTKYLSTLRQYLHTYSQNQLYKLYAKFGKANLSTYKLLKKIVFRIQLMFQIRNNLKQIIMHKKCQFQGNWIMVVVKKSHTNVYNVTKKYPYLQMFSLSIINQHHQQLCSIQYQNPLWNLVILPKDNKLLFLKDYLKENHFMIFTAVKKFQFKIKLQIKRRQILFYKVIKMNRFYETFYHDFHCKYNKKNQYIEDVTLDVLFIVRCKTENKDKYWHITIETIKSYPSKYNFIIFDEMEPIGQNFSIQQYFQDRIISLTHKKIIPFIRFHNQQPVPINNLNKLIKIQTVFKIKLDRKKFQLKRQQFLLKNNSYKFSIIFNKEYHILITMIRLDCINIYLEDIKIFHSVHKLTYHEKYYKVIKNVMDNIQPDDLIGLLLIKELIQNTINDKINKYQEDLKQLQKLKPQKYQSRLKRFFVNIFLRMKARRNIIYVKKIMINSSHNTTSNFINTFNNTLTNCNYNYHYVLIVSKSKMLKNIIDINLYRLYSDNEWKSQYKDNCISINSLKSNEIKSGIMDNIISNAIKTQHLSIKIEKQQLNRYIINKKQSKHQSIHLFDNYFRKYPSINIEQQFYINHQHLLLKPPKKPNQHYINRITPVDINSQQFLKQLHLQFNHLVKKVENRRQGMMMYNRDSLLSNMQFKNINNNNTFLNQNNNDSMIPAINRGFYQVKENHHKNILYFSLFKTSQKLFYLDIYVVNLVKSFYRECQDEQLHLVHRQQVAKKQIIQSSYSFVYMLIAKWLRNNNRLEYISDTNSQKLFCNLGGQLIQSIYNELNLSRNYNDINSRQQNF